MPSAREVLLSIAAIAIAYAMLTILAVGVGKWLQSLHKYYPRSRDGR